MKATSELDNPNPKCTCKKALANLMDRADTFVIAQSPSYDSKADQILDWKKGKISEAWHDTECWLAAALMRG